MESNKTSKTKTKIVEVANELLSENNFIKTTMEAIATRAELSRRTIYMHFDNKEDILRYVVKSETSNIIKKLKKIELSTLPADRKLKLYILTRFNVIDKLIKRNRSIRYDFVFNQHRLEKLRKAIDKTELGLLTKIISEGKETCIFTCNDTDDFARIVQWMFKSLEQPFVIRNSRIRTYAVLNKYIDMLFNGILNKKRQ